MRKSLKKNKICVKITQILRKKHGYFMETLDKIEIPTKFSISQVILTAKKDNFFEIPCLGEFCGYCFKNNTFERRLMIEFLN